MGRSNEIKAEFDEEGLLDSALITSEKYDLRIVIKRSFNELEFYVKFGPYDIEFNRGYIDRMPAFVKKDYFYEEFTSPLRALQIVMSILMDTAYDILHKVDELKEGKKRRREEDIW
jgi:hypothetical protein